MLRALGVLCTEKKRQEYRQLLERDEISRDVVSASIRILIPQVRLIMDPTFEGYLAHAK